MKLRVQKRLAASLLKRSPKRIRFDPAQLHEIKESITKSDLRLLVSDGVISGVQKRGVSRARARKIHTQKRKGLRRGHGSKKGTFNANLSNKDRWMARVRSQRKFLQELKEKGLVTVPTYRALYLKSKGGFFRSQRHIKLYLDDQRLWQKKDAPATKKAAKRKED